MIRGVNIYVARDRSGHRLAGRIVLGPQGQLVPEPAPGNPDNAEELAGVLKYCTRPGMSGEMWLELADAMVDGAYVRAVPFEDAPDAHYAGEGGSRSTESP